MKNKQSQMLKIFLLLMLMALLLTATAIAQSEDIYEITLNYKKTINGGALSLIDIKITEGTVVDYKLNPPNSYKIDIVSSDGGLLKSTRFVVPVGAVLGLSHANAQGTPNDLNFTISVPYFKNANLINIYDEDNNKILEILLKPEVNLSWLYISLPIIVILGFLVYVEFKRKQEHAELMQKFKQQNILSLRNYIITSLRRGYSKEQIRNMLIKSGYNNQEIKEAFMGIR